MLWSMYWLNYLDRNAIALARLNDLEEDLNLKGTGKPHRHIFKVLTNNVQSTKPVFLSSSSVTSSARSPPTCSSLAPAPLATW